MVNKTLRGRVGYADSSFASASASLAFWSHASLTAQYKLACVSSALAPFGVMSSAKRLTVSSMTFNRRSKLERSTLTGSSVMWAIPLSVSSPGPGMLSPALLERS